MIPRMDFLQSSWSGAGALGNCDAARKELDRRALLEGCQSGLVPLPDEGRRADKSLSRGWYWGGDPRKETLGKLVRERTERQGQGQS